MDKATGYLVWLDTSYRSLVEFSDRVEKERDRLISL